MKTELLNRMHQLFHIASVNQLPLPNDWIQLGPYLHQKGFKRIDEVPESRLMALIAWYDQQISDATDFFVGRGEPDKISVKVHSGNAEGEDAATGRHNASLQGVSTDDCGHLPSLSHSGCSRSKSC